MPIGTWWQGTASDGAKSFVVSGGESNAPIVVERPTFYALGPGLSPRTIMGSGQAGATVTLKVDGVVEDSEVIDQNGEWAIAVLRPPGTYSLTATQTYQGETSDEAGPVTMIVHQEQTPPPSSGSSGRDAIRRSQSAGIEKPPITAGSPQRLQTPFKTPKRWAGE